MGELYVTMALANLLMKQRRGLRFVTPSLKKASTDNRLKMHISSYSIDVYQNTCKYAKDTSYNYLTSNHLGLLWDSWLVIINKFAVH